MRLLPFTGALCHEWERLKHPAPTLCLTGGEPSKSHFILLSFTEKEKERKKKKKVLLKHLSLPLLTLELLGDPVKGRWELTRMAVLYNPSILSRKQ